MLTGLEANLRLMRAAGAKMLYFGHENFPWFFCGKGVAPSAGGADNVAMNNVVDRVNCTSPTNITRTPFTSTDDERFEEYIRSMRTEGNLFVLVVVLLLQLFSHVWEALKDCV